MDFSNIGSFTDLVADIFAAHGPAVFVRQELYAG